MKPQFLISKEAGVLCFLGVIWYMEWEMRGAAKVIPDGFLEEDLLGRPSMASH